MSEAFQSETIRLGFIGGAASTIITIASLLPKIQNLTMHVELQVFDPDGLNPGPAYRLKSDAFKLNQPSGKEMNPFHGQEGHTPHSFERWLKQQHPEKGHSAGSFAERRLYGDYLTYLSHWIRSEVAAMPHVTLREIREQVETVSMPPHQPGSSAHRYNIHLADNRVMETNGFALATGHVFAPRIEHERYIPAYAGRDFEARVAAAALRDKEKVIIGSGASMVDNVCALEHFDYKGIYRVVSPYGRTYWPYDPNAPAPEGKKADILKSIVDSFATTPHRDPAEGLRRHLDLAGEYGIAPHFVIGTAIKDERIVRDSDLLAVTKAFYGNPLAPERFALMKQLETQGRIVYDTRRVDAVEADLNGQIAFKFGSGKVETVAGDVIDCTVVRRGVSDPRTGEIYHPLIASLVHKGIIDAPQNGALQTAATPGQPIWALGALTNSYKNGIETFCADYHAVAEEIAGHIRGMLDISARNFASARHDLKISRTAATL